MKIIQQTKRLIRDETTAFKILLDSRPFNKIV